MSTKTNDKTDTGLAPDYEQQPSAFALPQQQQQGEADDTAPMVNALTGLMDRAAASINELARRVACGVVLNGWLLGKARMASPMSWGKRFRPGAKGGAFAISQQRANQFIRCAAGVLERARAAGCEADLTAQLEAAAGAFRANPNIIPELPALAGLESDSWVSVHAMMIELGVVSPRKVRRLAADEGTAELPGLEELCAQCWAQASRMVGTFQLFIREDAAQLSRQQRATLRAELQALLADLDQLETTAPALQ